MVECHDSKRTTFLTRSWSKRTSRRALLVASLLANVAASGSGRSRSRSLIGGLNNVEDDIEDNFCRPGPDRDAVDVDVGGG